jgi:hypothetical protein
MEDCRNCNPFRGTISEGRTAAMRFTVSNGSLSGSLGLGGTGIALMLPEQKWIGAVLIVLSVLIFLFDVRVTRGSVHAGSEVSLWQRIKARWQSAFSGRDISLLEAATLAYEQTRDKIVSGFAEAFENTPSDILTWYSNALTRHRNGKPPLVTLYGIRPPSRQREEIYMAPLSSYIFEVESGAIVFQRHDGSGRYEQLTVKKDELRRAIAEVATWGG